MVSRHRKHLMDIERRKALKKDNEITHSNTLITNNQQETVMQSYIEKSKTFIKRHRKAFIIGGSIVAVVLAAAVTHKVMKNGRINDTIKNLGTVGFQPASPKVVKKEMKLEMKGAAKRNLQRALYVKFPNTNRYGMTEEGITTNLKTMRVLTPVFDTSGSAWQIQFVEDNQFKIDPVQRMIEIFAPVFAANAVETVAEIASEVTS